jgi:rRNA maturation endonuclease Nob1
VKSFSKETGDSKSLSWTDSKVIALGVQLAASQGELERVKTAPKPLAEFRPKQFEDDYKKIEEEDDSDEDESGSSDGNGSDGSEEEQPAQ